MFLALILFSIQTFSQEACSNFSGVYQNYDHERPEWDAHHIEIEQRNCAGTVVFYDGSSHESKSKPLMGFSFSESRAERQVSGLGRNDEYFETAFIGRNVIQYMSTYYNPSEIIKWIHTITSQSIIVHKNKDESISVLRIRNGDSPIEIDFTKI